MARSSSQGFWRRWWPRWLTAASAGVGKRAALWVPIRVLGARHRPRILAHLLALSAHDRYLRFGYAVSDEHLHIYVQALNFERDEIFGVFNWRLQLVAMAHLAFSSDPKSTSCAEFGVSVDARLRGRGVGAQLFGRAVTQARNEGVQTLFIHALTENAAMLKIARNAGAWVERDGTESDAYLRLPPSSLDSQFTGLVQNRIADVDYRIKQEWAALRECLATVQEIRHGVQQARHAHRA